MAVLEDLQRIKRLSAKAINITVSASQTTVQTNPGDEEGETVYTLTPQQRAAKLAERTAAIAEIKTLAAGLP